MAFGPQESLQNGRYTVEHVLKAGRFGISYLAHDRQGERVVLKSLRDELIAELPQADKDRWSNRFLREAGALARCAHPNIVKFREPFLERGTACLVMEYVAGTDLAELPTRTLPEAEALDYVRQVGAALMAVHRAGLVHRDVKPSNIVLRSGQRQVVLIDFGLARAIDETLHTTLTRSTTEDGYAPPEFYDPNATAQPHSDVYSLAATLYALLAGEPPPDAESLALKQRSLHQPQGSQPKTWRAIRQAMALDPDRRLQTVEEFLALLPAAAGTEATDEDPTLKEARAQTRIGRNTLWATVAIGVVSLLLAAWGLLSEPRSGETPRSPEVERGE